ncbi:MAG: glycine cleavage system protein GcvH [Verrucomicrobiota bacterium]|nr:glycine cleavage system protein GcvH [Verrucomicrobiota bacterium]
MSNIPADLKYTKDHEWLKPLADGTALVGITDYAQSTLGDVTFLELPKVGSTYGERQTFGVVESVKAASDLYMPVAAEVVEINTDLTNSPEKVNADPYGEAWMLRIRPVDAGATAALLSAAEYGALI